MLIVFVRAILLYLLIIFCIRLMGKRQLGDLQPSELAITILISNMATLAIENPEISMAFAAIPILALVGFELIFSTIALKSKKVRDIISGSPVVVIENGKIIQSAMKKMRFTIDDLMEALRGNSIFNITQVEYAIVETTGKVSVLQKFNSQTVTAEMMHLKGKETTPPTVLITDGVVINNVMKKYNLSFEWLYNTIRANKCELKEIFLMTVDNSNNYYIVLKDKK